MSAWKLSPLAIALVSAQSFAVQPVGVAMGSGFTLLPNVETTIESNDNIYAQDSDVVSSTLTRVAPSFSLKGDMGQFKLDSSYTLEQGIYDKNSDDDYVDQNLSVGGDYELNARNQLTADAIYNVGHDARGSAKGGENNISIKPDEFNEVTAGVGYTFGSESAPFNIDLSAKSYQKRYDNNEDVTETREHDKVSVAAKLAYTVSSATSLLLSVSSAEIDYVSNEDAALSREGSENTVLVGASWDISGATTGEFKIGVSEREFDQAGIDTETNLNWEGNLTWQPLSYSTVTVSTSQASAETSGAGNFIDSSYSLVSWGHEYTNFVSAGIKASYGEDEYEGTSRNDINTAYGVQVTYSPRNFLDVTVAYDLEERNSNVANLDSEANIFSLGLTLAL